MDVEGGFVSGATLHRDEDEGEQQPQASTSTAKQTTLGNFFGSTQGIKYETKRREREGATAKDCRKFVV